MARVLVLYGTTDGHTGKVGHFIAETLRAAGCEADLENAAHVTLDVLPARYDGVIVAGSVQLGGFQRALVRWVTAHRAELEAKPNAFLCVCLMVRDPGPETQRDLARVLADFQRRTLWRPQVIKLVAGALRYSRYGWLKRLIMKLIAAKHAGDTDTSRDYEYTDWDDLRSFVREFATHRAEAPHAVTG